MNGNWQRRVVLNAPQLVGRVVLNAPQLVGRVVLNAHPSSDIASQCSRILLRLCFFAKLLASLVGKPDAFGAGASRSGDMRRLGDKPPYHFPPRRLGDKPPYHFPPRRLGDKPPYQKRRG